MSRSKNIISAIKTSPSNLFFLSFHPPPGAWSCTPPNLKTKLIKIWYSYSSFHNVDKPNSFIVLPNLVVFLLLLQLKL